MNKDLQDVLDKYIDTFLNQEEVKQYFILEKEIENLNIDIKELKNNKPIQLLNINSCVTNLLDLSLNKVSQCLIKYILLKMILIIIL